MAFALGALALALPGCSSDSTSTSGTPTPTRDAGDASTSPTGDAGGAGTPKGDAAPISDATPPTDSAAPKSINGCTTYVDHTAAADPRTLTWDFSISTNADRCMTVKVGQKVKWAGNFTTHPLGASGGDTPNPVGSVSAAGEVTFLAAGTFGYVCTIHPAMIGAIAVVP